MRFLTPSFMLLGLVALPLPFVAVRCQGRDGVAARQSGIQTMTGKITTGHSKESIKEAGGARAGREDEKLTAAVGVIAWAGLLVAGGLLGYLLPRSRFRSAVMAIVSLVAGVCLVVQGFIMKFPLAKEVEAMIQAGAPLKVELGPGFWIGLVLTSCAGLIALTGLALHPPIPHREDREDRADRADRAGPPAAVQIRCPKCQTQLRLTGTPKPGSVIRCPKCSTGMKISGAAPSPSPSAARMAPTTNHTHSQPSLPEGRGGRKAIVWVLAGIAAIGLVVVGVVIGTNLSQKQVKADFKLTSGEYAAEFDKDMRAAKEKYSNKSVELTGRVVGVGRNSPEGSHLILAGSGDRDFAEKVFCVTQDPKPWRNARPGQTVRLLGKGSPEPDRLTLSQCEVIEVTGKSPAAFTADQLVEETLKGEEAEKKLLEKHVITSGDIESIDFPEGRGIEIAFKINNEKLRIHATLSAVHKDEVSTIKVGQHVTLMGIYSTLPGPQAVILHECVVMDVKN